MNNDRCDYCFKEKEVFWVFDWKDFETKRSCEECYEKDNQKQKVIGVGR